MEVDPRYTAPARTAQKTPIPTAEELLEACLLQSLRDAY
jgi:hypothetical protein